MGASKTYVFISNYYNHHQAPFSEAMERLTNGNYYFIETEPMEKERRDLGWGENAPAFVKRSYESEQIYRECQALVDSADVAIIGSAPDSWISKRLKEKFLTLRYSERIYRQSFKEWQRPLRFVKYYWRHGRHKRLYMLCASAFTAADYAKTATFLGKTYKWGYFPAVKRYDDFDAIMGAKSPTKILWCARFLDLKHPEAAVYVAKKLKVDGYKFELDIIGGGELDAELRRWLKEADVEDCVRLLGTMRPEQVRDHMEKAGIFLFTSDFQEGWGAVLNESMNSGCAVVASHAIGSVPYLVKHNENGLVFENENWEDLYRNVKKLLDAPEEQRRLGSAAYRTLLETWNAETAAERLLALTADLETQGKSERFTDGPCSRAKITPNNWFGSKE